MVERIGEIAIPTVQETRDRYLRDLRLTAIDDGFDDIPVTPGTDNWIHAAATAEAVGVALANVAIADSNSDELTAEGEALDAKLVSLGLPLIEPTGSAGKIKIEVTGTTTINAGEQLLLPNGLRLQTVSTTIAPSDGDEIDVQAVDTGPETNAVAGTEVRWVVAPANVGEIATVSVGEPLTGGTGEETDERKRARIRNYRENRPAGGNWGQVREISLNASGAVQEAYSYPAVGGPSTGKTVPTRIYDRDNFDFSREPSSTTINIVKGSIQTSFPIQTENIVQPPNDTAVNVALGVTIPNSVSAGGDGTGWVNPQIWPTLVGGDSGRVTVTSYTGVTLTVTAATTTAPVDLQTQVSWWSPTTMKFYTATVVSHSGGTGAWVLTLDKPLVDDTGAIPATGDFISPAAVNIEKYGVTWLDIMEIIGPGEMVGSSDSRFNRSRRHPYVNNEFPANLDQAFYNRLQNEHKEMSGVSEKYASANTPTVPATIDLPPNIFVPQHFGIYPE